jgi:hypothetical protein
MTEAIFWRDTVKPYLSPFGVMHRVENTVETGTPDVTYTLRHPTTNLVASGWIELKETTLPVRPTTIVRFKRFTAEQADWLYDWAKVGGRAWLLVRLGNKFSLIDGLYAPSIQQGVSLSMFWGYSAVRGDNAFPAGRILKCLTA